MYDFLFKFKKNIKKNLYILCKNYTFYNHKNVLIKFKNQFF